MEDPWRITLFGGLAASRGGRTVVRFGTRKAAQLLGFLALHPGKTFPREALADRFWGEDTPATARQNLRAALSLLRRALDDTLFDADRERVGLRRGAATTDLEAFDALLEQASRAGAGNRLALLERATALASGELLEGDDQLAAHGERARLVPRLCQALRQQASLLRERGDEAGARACLLRLVALDPEAPEMEKARTPSPERRAGRPSLIRPVSRFVGRAAESERLVGLLAPESPTALASVLGPGGMGKTRLCLEVARLLQPRFAATAFVALADLGDAEALYPAVAAALGLAWERSESPEQRLAESIVLPTLLVLDNAEPLLPALAVPVLRLLERAPALKVLVSSREALGIDGEHEFWLGPLSPEDARTLLHDRAPTPLSPDPADDAALRTIAERLDGLPLALELAAARLRVYSPSELCEQLRLDLLATRDVTRPARHRTMRAAIAGSYDRMDARERGFFAALAILRGDWPASAAAAVTGESPPETRALLERLLETALLTPAPPSNGERRFRLLEPLREFGDGCRTDAQTLALRQRHADHFLTLGEAIERGLSEDRLSGYARLDAEEPNLDAALAFALRDTPPRLVRAWRLATRLRWTWWVRGRMPTALSADIDRLYVDRIAELEASDPTAHAEARLLLARRGGDPGEISRALEHQREVCLTRGDGIGAAVALEGLGKIAADDGDLALATERIRRAAGECDAHGDPRRATWMLANLASLHLRMAPLPVWEALARECRERSRRFEGEDATAVWDREFGWQAFRRGVWDEAAAGFRAAAEKFYRRGEWRLQAHSLLLLGLTQKTVGQIPDAWHDARRLFVYLRDTAEVENLDRRLAGEEVPVPPWPPTAVRA